MEETLKISRASLLNGTKLPRKPASLDDREQLLPVTLEVAGGFPRVKLGARSNPLHLYTSAPLYAPLHSTPLYTSPQSQRHRPDAHPVAVWQRFPKPAPRSQRTPGCDAVSPR